MVPVLHCTALFFDTIFGMIKVLVPVPVRYLLPVQYCTVFRNSLFFTSDVIQYHSTGSTIKHEKFYTSIDFWKYKCSRGTITVLK